MVSDDQYRVVFDLSQKGRGPVLVLISGVEAGGRGETANKLTEWMDPRHIRVVAFGERTPEDAAHPPAWRYWKALPPKGRLGIFMNAKIGVSADAMQFSYDEYTLGGVPITNARAYILGGTAGAAF